MDSTASKELMALRAIAENCCNSWLGKINPDDPQLELRFHKTFDQALQTQIIAAMERNDDRFNRIAEALLTRWIADGVVEVEEPSAHLRDVIEAGFQRLERRTHVFKNAAKQKKVQALALAESRVPYAQIARELGVTARTAKGWVEDVRKDLEEMRQILDIYGYRMVKAEDK